MTEVPTPWNGATFFKVLCRLGVNRPDYTTDPDRDPELLTIAGKVEIDASIPRFRYTEVDGRARMVSMPKDNRYTVDPETGELSDDTDAGVYLLDTSSTGVDPSGFTYSAIVRPSVGAPWEVVFSGHQPSGIIDLVAAATIAPSVGVTGLDARIASVAETGFAPYQAEVSTKAETSASPPSFIFPRWDIFGEVIHKTEAKT